MLELIHNSPTTTVVVKITGWGNETDWHNPGFDKAKDEMLGTEFSNAAFINAAGTAFFLNMTRKQGDDWHCTNSWDNQRTTKNWFQAEATFAEFQSNVLRAYQMMNTSKLWGTGAPNGLFPGGHPGTWDTIADKCEEGLTEAEGTTLTYRIGMQEETSDRDWCTSETNYNQGNVKIKRAELDNMVKNEQRTTATISNHQDHLYPDLTHVPEEERVVRALQFAGLDDKHFELGTYILTPKPIPKSHIRVS